MIEHRVRRDSEGYWVEIDRDSWLPIDDEPTHASIHDMIDRISKGPARPIRYDERAFYIGIVAGWEECYPVGEGVA